MPFIGDLPLGRNLKERRLCKRMNSFILTINECIDERRLFPALTLIYSSIDVLGSLKNEDGYASSDSFKSWVTDYLFTIKTFHCSDEDLYSARCGILHTMRYDSKNPLPKLIVYGFHGYDRDIQNIKDHTKQVGIYLEDLFDAFTKAYFKYIEGLEGLSNPIIDANLAKLPKYVDLIPIDL